jgi:hypothetical protein
MLDILTIPPAIIGLEQNAVAHSVSKNSATVIVPFLASVSGLLTTMSFVAYGGTGVGIPKAILAVGDLFVIQNQNAVPDGGFTPFTSAVTSGRFGWRKIIAGDLTGGGNFVYAGTGAGGEHSIAFRPNGPWSAVTNNASLFDASNNNPNAISPSVAGLSGVVAVVGTFSATGTIDPVVVGGSGGMTFSSAIANRRTAGRIWGIGDTPTSTDLDMDDEGSGNTTVGVAFMVS